MSKYKIGVDVGGTNTDAVILDSEQHLIASVKTPTTEDIETGIEKAIKDVLDQAGINPKEIYLAMLGTTQCTNAIVERKKLNKVGVIRIGAPATASVPPFTDWPEDLKDAIGNKTAIVHGGYEYDGREISPFDEEEVKGILNKWQGEIESLAVIGVFSSVNSDQENRVAELAKEIYGTDFPVSVSANIGSIGLIDRENSTILNASLHSVISATTEGFTKAQEAEGITNAKIFLCQNNGTLMSVDYATEYPILTIASGPTNSIRGAAFLEARENAITLDVGGTTSDFGILKDGFPRQSSVAVNVGGVRTNFRIPDIVSIGLGGGTIVRVKDGEVTVGPDSVGHHIQEEAIVFGGDTITATDVAVRLGRAQVGQAELANSIPLDIVEQADAKIKELLETSIDIMKTDPDAVDVIAVGGGSIIVPNNLKGVGKLMNSQNGSVANAIGASISQIGGEFEQLYVYDEFPREKAIQEAKDKASEVAIAAGALPESIDILEIEEVPLQYAGGNTTRVKVKVIGDMINKA
ncbi:hydantoinase/oxoprolinase N-terminal domain-containing protein [Aerococcus mictus]